MSLDQLEDREPGDALFALTPAGKSTRERGSRGFGFLPAV